MENGSRLEGMKTLQELQKIGIENLEKFHKSYKRQINPHIYKVSLSSKLKNLKTDIIKEERLRQES